MNVTPQFGVVVLGVLLTMSMTGLPGQEPLRVQGVIYHKYATALETGSLFAPMNDDAAQPAVLEWAVYSAGAVHRATLALPLNLVGGAAVLDERHYIIGGHRATDSHGVLCKLELLGNPGSMSIQVSETRSYPERDFWSLTWHQPEGRLYASDWDAKVLLAADVLGWASPLPSAWDTASTSAEVKWLGEQCHVIRRHPDSAQPGVIIGPEKRTVATWVWFDPPTWRSAPFVATPQSPPYWRVDRGGLYDESGLLRFAGIGIPGPTQVDVLSVMDGDIELSVSHPGGSAEIATAAPGVFWDLPGRPYRLASAVVTSPAFRPMVSYGQPTATAQITARLVIVDPRSSHRNNPDFGVLVGFTGNLAIPAGTTFSGCLSLAVRGPSGDPVVDVGGVKLLIPDVVLDTTLVTQHPGARLHERFVPLGIPDDPDIENTVFLYQSLFVDSLGGVIASSVIATSVLPVGSAVGVQGARTTGGSRRVILTEEAIRERQQDGRDYLGRLMGRRDQAYWESIRRRLAN